MSGSDSCRHVRPLDRTRKVWPGLVLAGLLGATAQAAVPPDWYTRPVPLRVVHPVTDQSSAYSAVVDARGGELEALDDAGNSYLLTVPPGALPGPTLITVTPLSRVNGLPFQAGLALGARLEPHGLNFLHPASLVITPAKALDLKSLMPWRVEGERQHLDVIAAQANPNQIIFTLNHFSDYGTSSATETERSVESARPALEAQEQLERDIAEVIGKERQNQLLDPDEKDKAVSPEYLDRIRELVKEYRKQVLDPLRAAAHQNCALANLYMRERINFARQVKRLVVGSEWADEELDILGEGLSLAVGQQCLKEEFELCLTNGGDVAGLVVWAIGWERSRQLASVAKESDSELGSGPLADSLRDYVRRCGRYEVEVVSTLTNKGVLPAAKGFIYLGPTSLDLQIGIKARISVEYQASLEAGISLPAAKGSLNYTQYQMNSAFSMTTFGGVTTCSSAATGTRPGNMQVKLELVFRNKQETPKMNTQGLSGELQKIVARLPKLGLLSAPRELDLEHSKVNIQPGEPTEVNTMKCVTSGRSTSETQEDQNWLGEWERRMSSVQDEQQGWLLDPLISAPGVLARLIQHDDGSRAPLEGFSKLWDLRIDLKHTPKR